MLDKSARESLQTFSSGKGDVLLGYENEAILAQQKGEELDYVVPDQTILIENPVAADDRGEGPGARAVVRGLPLHATRPRRSSWARATARSWKGIPGADKFPTPADLFDITKFGGWDEVNTDFFDPEKGVVAKIFQSQGKSTASD